MDPILQFLYLFVFFIILVIVIRFFDFIPRLVFFYLNISNNSAERLIEINKLHEYVEIPCKKGNLEGLFLPSKSKLAILIIPDLLQSNDTNHYLFKAKEFQELGFNVLFFRIPSEKATKGGSSLHSKFLYSCSLAALNFLKTYEHIDRYSIGIYSTGFSCNVASEISSKEIIKSLIFENGPINFWSWIKSDIRYDFSILLTVIRILSKFKCLKSIWKADYALDQRRDTPVLFISNYSNLYLHNNYLLKLYSKAYQPKSIWLEDSIFNDSLYRIWQKEYKMQIVNFLNQWLTGTDNTDISIDYVSKKVKNGLYEVKVDISCIPPQSQMLPLEITILSKNTHETFRETIIGNSITLEAVVKAKPTYVYCTRYFNVDIYSTEDKITWMKNDIEMSTLELIEVLKEIPPKFRKNYKNTIPIYWYIKMKYAMELINNEEFSRCLKIIKQEKLYTHKWFANNTNLQAFYKKIT